MESVLVQVYRSLQTPPIKCCQENLDILDANKKVSDQAKEIQHLKAQIKKFKKQAKPVIKHHRAWLQSVSLKQKLARKRSSKKQRVHQESVSKQGRKFAKGEIHQVQRDPLLIEFLKIQFIIWKQRMLRICTDEQRKGTEDHTEEGSATQATQTPTSTIFGDDETIAKVLLNMSQAKAVSREKEKGPLPKIDPKDKGKKKIEEEDESESESDGEEERNRIAKEKATNEALIRNFDDIKARIEADRLLVEKLQEQEREQFTIEERAKFLHDTIAAQRKFLAQQRSEAIRNRPPTKNQLRNQMMTYLKHIKRSDEDFISIGSAEDERLIKRMNEKGIDSSKDQMVKEESKEVIKEESKEEVQEESKEEESKRKRKLGTRKKMKSRKRRFIQNTSEDDSEKENDELRLHLTIAPNEEKNNGQKRYFSTLMRVLSIFDREDLNAVYQLVQDDENEFWNSQQDWNISGVRTATVFLQAATAELEPEDKVDGLRRDKYVAEILKKFNYIDVKSASPPVDLEKPLVKDGDADDVDVHLYRSMIGSLMYLTASRPDIMFAICACARFQVTPKTSHILAVKRIFRYLKGKPTLGLWYSRDSPFELVAYTDSDYDRATQDMKSTTGGC
ncbi:hypothetical protein Tco_0189424 [Tanacetum coccineum]